MKAEKQRAKEPRRFRISLSYSILSAVIAFVLLLSVVFSLVGYISFTASLTREYTDTGFRTANTAATLVDGNRMEAYLAGTEDDPDYPLNKHRCLARTRRSGYEHRLIQCFYRFFLFFRKSVCHGFILSAVSKLINKKWHRDFVPVPTISLFKGEKPVSIPVRHLPCLQALQDPSESG